MALYNTVKQDILKNREIKASGKFVGIPVPFPRLAQYIPIIEKGHSIGILGATGSGKSRFTRWMFLYHVYKFHRKTGYPIKIIYFPLEDSKEKVYRNMICHYMHELYGIYINLQELDSKGRLVLPEFVVEKLKEAERFFEDFEQVVNIVDGLNEPTEIFNYCQEYAERTGHVEDYVVSVAGKDTIQKRYIADNNVHTIIIIDNISNIDVEKGSESEREAIVKFCKTYVRGRLCNFFNFTVVQVLQQDFATERQSYTTTGETIISKLEPSLAGIGDSKTISRSMHIVMGLFHPSRYGILQYPKPTKRDPQATYRLDILGNTFRSLSILKANDTDFGMKVAMYFGAVEEEMNELPQVKTQEIEDIYRRVQEKHPEKFSTIKESTMVIHEDEDDETPF
jgi:hypothetical protein